MNYPFFSLCIYYKLIFCFCQNLIAAILETVGFEPTPQFLQNRFKEKDCWPVRGLYRLVFSATVTPRFHKKLDTFYSGWARTNDFPPGQGGCSNQLSYWVRLGQLISCMCLFRTLDRKFNRLGCDGNPASRPPGFHHFLLNFYSAPIATGAFRLVLLKG